MADSRTLKIGTELLVSSTPSGMISLHAAVAPPLLSFLDDFPLHFINTVSAMLEVAESESCGLPFVQRKIDGREPNALCIPEIAL